MNKIIQDSISSPRKTTRWCEKSNRGGEETGRIVRSRSLEKGRFELETDEKKQPVI